MRCVPRRKLKLLMPGLREWLPSLSLSWKIHVERCELKLTGVLISVIIQCSFVLFTGEAMLCHGPGWRGGGVSFRKSGWIYAVKISPGTLWLYQSKFNWFLPPYKRVNSPNPTYPGVAVFQKLVRSLAQASQNKTLYDNFFSPSLKKKRIYFQLFQFSIFNRVPWFRHMLHPQQCQAHTYALLIKK